MKTRILQVAVMLLAGALGARPRPPATAPADSDPACLARQLKQLRTTELLAPLAEEPAVRLAGELVRLEMTELAAAVVATDGTYLLLRQILADAKVAMAREATTEATRNRLFDEALAIQGKLIALTRGAVDEKGRLRHLRLRLKRIVTEGIERADYHVGRIQYFIDRPSDRKAADKLTAAATADMDWLFADVKALEQKWNANRKMIVLPFSRLEALKTEIRYRRAWVRFHRAMALPKGAAGRTRLLRGAIKDVKPFIPRQVKVKKGGPGGTDRPLAG